MKNKMHSKAILALVLSVVMVISIIPATALRVSAVENSHFHTGIDPTDATKWSVWPEGSVSQETEGVKLSYYSGSASTLAYLLPDALTQDFTVKFSVQVPNEADKDERAYIELGSAAGSSSSFGLLLMAGNSTRTDRMRIYKGNTSNSAYVDSYFTTKNTWHDVRIDVSPASGTFSVTLDGEEKATDFPFAAGASFTRVIFRTYSSTAAVNVKNFEIFTSDMEGAADWTVTKQAFLGENIGFTFFGKAGAMTGIKSVRATVGATVVTEAVGEDGAYSVILPVAASQMAETITLEGLDAEGTALQTKTYTVAEYLAEVKATDETAYGSIVDHTLNYGSAAAAYFNGAAVTAPAGLTLAEVPAAEGVGIDVSTIGLSYMFPNSVTEDYTLEFKYQVAAAGETTNGAARVYICDTSVSDSKSQVKLQITGAYNNETYGDRIKVNAGGTVTGMKDDALTYGEWHSVKVVVTQAVDGAAGKVKVYVDGSNVSADTAFQTATVTSVNRISFTNGTIRIDDVKFTVGESNVLLDDDFTTFAPTITSAQPTGVWYCSNAANVTHYTEMANPVSGTCNGVTAESANLLFEDRVKIRYKLQLADGKNIDDYTLMVAGEAVDAANVVSAGNNAYYVYSKGINPQHYGTDAVLTVSDGTDTITVTYSPLDYIQRMYEKEGTSAELKTLLKAMYNYYQAANTYLAN